MKKTYYTFSESDIEAITTALQVLPNFDFVAPDIADATFIVITAATQKLAMQLQPTIRERAIIALAIDSAYKALRNELPLNEEYQALLQPYLFTYNKLQPVFSPFLNS